MGGDHYQYCGICRRKFLSYPGGRPICLGCWVKENPAVVLGLGADPSGIMAGTVFPEVEPMSLEDEEREELFPTTAALLGEGNE